MTDAATSRHRIGRTGISLSRLGFGAASIAGLYTPVGEDLAAATLRHAWDLGIRYFDVAPFYGFGLGERRLGAGLRDRARNDYVISTKVGRLIDAEPARAKRDYTRDGVLRSFESSLTRMGLDRVDVLLIHDPDNHWKDAIDHAYPALHRLREQGVVGAIGVGMNQSAMLARFAREGDFDVFLIAGRYTLLDQSALVDALPICEERKIAVVVGGIMNSGILADPHAGANFDYRRADPSILAKAQRIATICARFGVPLKAAAMQFPLAHPAVISLLAGVRTIAHLDEYPSLMQYPIPNELWQALRDMRLLPVEAPTPSR